MNIFGGALQGLSAMHMKLLSPSSNLQAKLIVGNKFSKMQQRQGRSDFPRSLTSDRPDY
jgi:hypothetical protein